MLLTLIQPYKRILMLISISRGSYYLLTNAYSEDLNIKFTEEHFYKTETCL